MSSVGDRPLWVISASVALLALTGSALLALDTAWDAPASTGDWPQWLGPQRNGEALVGASIATWPASGPAEVWRRPMGEGFSGFAVVVDRAFTMDMDKQGEHLVCLDATTGEQRWRLRSGPRYLDSQGGNGPRSTPSVHRGRVFTISANGDLLAAEADTGTLIWRRRLVAEFGAKRPTWGFSGSPLVSGNAVYVEAGGSGGRALIALRADSGDVLWESQTDGLGYASPVQVTAAGATQLLFFTAAGLVSLAPEDGALNFRFPWTTSYDVNAATPLFIPPDRVFISSGYGTGGAVVRIERSSESLGVQEVWQSRTMRNHMATSVFHKGHIYGIDEKMLKCIDAASGKERWRARGYGKGTLILAGDDLLVLGDRGKLGLVEANSAAFVERSSIQALSDLCWTAPSLAAGRLYLRSTSEAVCLQLTQAP